MLWCDAKFASHASALTCSMHQTSIYPWDKVIEEYIIFRFRPESGNRRSVGGYDKLKKIAPLSTRPWDKAIIPSRLSENYPTRF